MKKLLIVFAILGLVTASGAQSANPGYDEMDARFSKDVLTRKDSLSFSKSAESDIRYFATLVNAYSELGNDTSGMAEALVKNVMLLLDSSIKFSIKSGSTPLIDPTTTSGCRAMLDYLVKLDALKTKGINQDDQYPAHLSSYIYHGKAGSVVICADLKRVEKHFGTKTEVVWDVLITEIIIVKA